MIGEKNRIWDTRYLLQGGEFRKNKKMFGFNYRIHVDMESEIVSRQLLEDKVILKLGSGDSSFILRGLRIRLESIWNRQIRTIFDWSRPQALRKSPRTEF